MWLVVCICELYIGVVCWCVWCLVCVVLFFFFFFQAEDGIRVFCLSRGLGDVYKGQAAYGPWPLGPWPIFVYPVYILYIYFIYTWFLYTSDAADDLLCVDFGGRRIIKKKIISTAYTPLTLPTNLSVSLSV